MTLDSFIYCMGAFIGVLCIAIAWTLKRMLREYDIAVAGLIDSQTENLVADCAKRKIDVII